MTETARDATSTLARIRGALRDRFGVDPRALAAFRFSLGAVLLLDLALRARDLVAFYTDSGAVPRSAAARQYPGFHSLSVHALSGDAWVQGALFALAAAVAVALAVGYRTRLATAASLVLLVSLHARNPFVLNAGDVLLRRLVFWSLFLPLGRRWAVDARQGGRVNAPVAGLATVGLLHQVVLVYATNVGFKLRGDTWVDGDAIRYVFELDQFTTGFGSLLAGYPALLGAGAVGWFVLLCSSWLLIALAGRARAALVALFAGGHVAMLVTMDLGVFPLVSLVALLPFVPSPVWNRVGERLSGILPRVDGWGPADPVPRVGPVIRTGDRTRRLRSAFLGTLVVAMLLLNAVAVGVVDRPAAVPDAVEDRSWNMFGNPPRAESWYVASGTFESGREVTGHVATDRFDRPPDGEHRYPKARWRKYQQKLAESGDEAMVGHLAADVCRRWSAAGDEPLRSVTLDRVTEGSRLDGPDVRESETVGRYDCSAVRAR